jgi:hypothetical protein
MKKIPIILLFVIISFITHAQSSWEVSSADYEFSMNITGKVKLNSTFVEQPTSLLGAFVGDECRGVVSALEVKSGDFYYFISIFSNTAYGESVTIKFKDTTGVVHALPQSVIFVADAIYGISGDPYLWMSPEEFGQTDFSSFSVANQVGETEIDRVNKIVNVVVQSESNIQEIVVSYKVQPGAKVLINNVEQESGVSANDFTNNLVYKIDGVDGTTADWTVNIAAVITGIDQTLLKDVGVYPTILENNRFYVRSDEPLNYEIINVLGSTIQNGITKSGVNSIYLRREHNGILFLRLTNAKNEIKTVKLLAY